MAVIPMTRMNKHVKGFQTGEIYYFGKKQLKEKQRQHSCLIFEVVPLVGQGSISIFFRKERVLEKDIPVILRRLPPLGKLSSILMVRVSFSFRETDI